MASTLLRPYELPPFEVVRLIQPAFAQASTSSSASTPLLPVGSPVRAASPPGPSSPPPPGPSLSNRLSQLVAPKLPPGQPGQSALRGGTAEGNAINALSSLPIASTAATKQAVRCVEAGGDTLCIGGNEGSVAVWKLDASRAKGKQRATDDSAVSSSAEEAAYLLDQHNVVLGRRPVEKLAVLPTVGKALVLSEGTLTLHALPNFVPLSGVAPIRGVSTFAVDISTPQSNTVNLCVIKRKSMQLYRISQTHIEHLKELPLRTTAILGVLRRSHLCIADSVHYSLVDLESATLIPLLPISQDPPESPPEDAPESSLPEAAKPKSYQRPSIVAVGEDEFLVASHTAHTTLGLFIRENGEPTRGTLEWASNPKSIVIDHPYVIALLQNNTLEVHSLITQEIVQVIQLNTAFLPKDIPKTSTSPIPNVGASPKGDSFLPRGLVSCTAGYPFMTLLADGSSAGGTSPLFVPTAGGSDNVEKVLVKLAPEGNTFEEASDKDPDAHRKPPLTPPPFHHRPTSALTNTRPSSTRRLSSVNFTTVGARTLVYGKDSIIALCPLTLVAQADALMSSNRVRDALALLHAIGSPDTPEKLEEFRYIQEKAAWVHLLETNFKDAGPLFQAARTDPRLLIRLFPDLCGNMLKTLHEEEVPVYKGVHSMLDQPSLQELTVDAIIRNYSPHLPPTSPSIVDLHGKLGKTARRMLLQYLQEWRRTRRDDGMEALGIDPEDIELVQDLDKLVDTVLAKLYLEDPGRSTNLVDMLEKEAHSCDVDELASLLEQHAFHWYLSQLYLADGRVRETLAIWTELVDNKRHDERFSDGRLKVFNLLETSVDEESVMKYGLWLVERDQALGLKLLTKPAQGVQLNVDVCLGRLRSISQEAADVYLEHVVYTRRNISAIYHDDLIERYISKLVHLLNTTDLAKQLALVRKEYAETPSALQMSLVSFVFSKSIHPDALLLRGKLVILLHASSTYDVGKVRQRLDESAMQELHFERAIAYGRLGLHQQVLTILAVTLRDLVAAESYCTHAGTGLVLGPKTVREILSRLAISSPPALLRKDGRRRTSPVPGQPASTTGPALPASPAEREKKRRELLNLLIKISLEQCSVIGNSHTAAEPGSELKGSLADDRLALSSSTRAAHLIETQAVHINALEILPSIPSAWPLPFMESFFTRSLRRSLHERYEHRLLKGLLQGQDMDTSLKWYERMEAEGGTLAEEADGPDGGDDEVGEKVVFYEEKNGVAMHQNEKAVELL